MKRNNQSTCFPFQIPRAAASLGLASAMLLGHSTASAALIASDSFAVGVTGGYTAERVTNQNSTVGISGFTGNWTTTGPSTNDIQFEAGGLSGSLVKGSTSAGKLSHIGTGANARSGYHQFASVPASSTYFYSFLLSSALGNSAQFGLSPIGNGQAVQTQGVRVGVTSANNIVLSVDGLTSTLLAGYTAATTYFVLVDITNVAGTANDTVGARIYSSTATDLLTPLGTATPISTADISSDLTYLGFSKNATTGGGMDVDEFRFGTELSDVAVIPEPSSVAMLFGGLGLACLIRRRAA